MATLTMAQTYALARQAGFDPAAATVMAAIDMAESGLNPNAVGDVALETSTWGPSVGLGQIRTLKADTGTGRTRDIAKLRDPLGNMVAAYEISHHGKDFTPWTTYTSQKYRQFLGQASGAAGAGGTTTTNTGQVVQVGLADALGGGGLRTLGLQIGAIGFGLALLVAGAYQAVGSPSIVGGLKKAATVAAL